MDDPRAFTGGVDTSLFDRSRQDAKGGKCRKQKYTCPVTSAPRTSNPTPPPAISGGMTSMGKEGREIQVTAAEGNIALLYGQSRIGGSIVFGKSDYNSLQFDMVVGLGIGPVDGPYQVNVDGVKYWDSTSGINTSHPLYGYLKGNDGNDLDFGYSINNSFHDGSLNPKAITGISKASNGVVQCVGHGFSANEYAWIDGCAGMTEVNGHYHKILSVNTDDFTIETDTSTYGTYTSGGTADNSIDKMMAYRYGEGTGLITPEWKQMLPGLANLYICIHYPPGGLTALPEFLIYMKGKNDVRISNTPTYGYTRNAAWIIADALTREYGARITRLNWSSVSTVASTITSKYYIDTAIMRTADMQSWYDTLRGYPGIIVYDNGEDYVMRIDKLNTTNTMTLSKRHYRGPTPYREIKGDSKSNRVTVFFISSDWSTKSVSWPEGDGGSDEEAPAEKTYTYECCHDKEEAYRFATREGQRDLYGDLEGNVTITMEGFILEPLDKVTLTEYEDLPDTEATILKIEDLHDGTFHIWWRKYDSNIYSGV